MYSPDWQISRPVVQLTQLCLREQVLDEQVDSPHKSVASSEAVESYFMHFLMCFLHYSRTPVICSLLLLPALLCLIYHRSRLSHFIRGWASLFSFCARSFLPSSSPWRPSPITVTNSFSNLSTAHDYSSSIFYLNFHAQRQLLPYPISSPRR
jgi:hypothetical protein